MRGFCLTLGTIWVLAGCTGQTIEGRWRGPLPYRDASNCRIKIFSNGSFELACANDTWVGVGRYDFSGSKMDLRFTALTHLGQPVKDPLPLSFAVDGRGNTVVLANADGQTLTWRRTSHD